MSSDRRLQVWLAGGFVLVVVVITVVAAAISSNANAVADAHSNFKATQTAAITAYDWARGKRDAKVTVIEYGDFQCPACAQYEPIVQQVEKEYGDRVLFVFRNFPLTQAHPNAMLGAQAAEAAGAQGKYWQMHDLLYVKQSEWSLVSASSARTDIEGYAQSLGLDMTKFKNDIDSGAVKNKIQNDMTWGTQARVDHTPTFFLNLMQIKNPSGYAEFKSVLDAALASTTTVK